MKLFACSSITSTIALFVVAHSSGQSTTSSENNQINEYNTTSTTTTIETFLTESSNTIGSFFGGDQNTSQEAEMESITVSTMEYEYNISDTDSFFSDVEYYESINYDSNGNEIMNNPSDFPYYDLNGGMQNDDNGGDQFGIGNVQPGNSWYGNSQGTNGYIMQPQPIMFNPGSNQLGNGVFVINKDPSNNGYLGTQPYPPQDGPNYMYVTPRLMQSGYNLPMSGPNSLQSMYDPNSLQSIYDPNSLQSMYSPDNLPNMYGPNSLQNMYNPNSLQSMYNPNSLQSMYDPRNQNQMGLIIIPPSSVIPTGQGSSDTVKMSNGSPNNNMVNLPYDINGHSHDPLNGKNLNDYDDDGDDYEDDDDDDDDDEADVSSDLDQLGQDIKQDVENGLGTAYNATKTAGSTVKNFTSSAADTVGSTLANATTDAAYAAGATAGYAYQETKTATSTVKNVTTSAVNTVEDAAVDAYQGAKNFTEDAAGAVANTTVDAYTDVQNAADIVKNGTEDAASAVADSVGNGYRSANNAANTAASATSDTVNDDTNSAGNGYQDAQTVGQAVGQDAGDYGNNLQSDF